MKYADLNEDLTEHLYENLNEDLCKDLGKDLRDELKLPYHTHTDSYGQFPLVTKT